MLKKDTIGDYKITCDKCGLHIDQSFYDFRQAQEHFEQEGWLIEDSMVYCPECYKKLLDAQRQLCELVKVPDMSRLK